MANIELPVIKALVDKFLSENKGLMDELSGEAERLTDACDEIDRSWSGSFIGHHGAYYYGDLTPPPANNRWSIEWGTIHGVRDGWNTWEGEEIKAAIESKAKLKIEDVSKKTEKLANAAKKLETDIEIELSDVDFEGLEKEQELLSEIEKSDFDEKQAGADYVNMRVPKTRVSRDSAALMEGTYIPAHVTSRAGAYAADQIIERIEAMLGLIDRFARQVEKKQGALPKSAKHDAIAPLVKLEKLLSRFHAVAQQLRERHASRPTLIISDEYDVQDLLHSLLKIEFDDVRAEEWTPSYAGSASRMDFVLKKEGIVIEVKKTSASLRDKQIGEQLILDIAHYKGYEGARMLCCFIYDPDFLIKNREGLVYDLQKTHDGLDVRVAIYPQ